MSNRKPDFEKYLKKRSSRHHYIPQFLINGFTNNEGQLYVYDKQKDEILKRPRSPKSIFFENDRNTVDLREDLKSSVIEDLLYKEIDDKTSKIIKYYQSEELPKIDFGTEDTATFFFFLISLFWRIPKTDFAANELMDRSTIVADGIDPEVIRTDPSFRKINRAGLFKHHIDEIQKYGQKGTKSHNIHQNAHPVLVIGDYPILFRSNKSVVKFSEFDDDILIAVSSTRLYSTTKVKLNTPATKYFFQYNACIINQSVKYIACGNLEVLQTSILYYKKLKELWLINNLSESLFSDLSMK